MESKRSNENTNKIKKIKLYMIFGYAAIIIIMATIMTRLSLIKTDEVLKSKVSELTYALNEQMKLNINTYLTKLEDLATLVFGTEEIYTYDASDPANDEYEALNTEKLIYDKLSDLCIMENYVDFFIVYSNDHTVGKLSNGTINLFEEELYSDFEATITSSRTNDGWSTGYNGDFRRIYYTKRLNENALLVASFYTSELERVFVRPEDMKDTAIRLVTEDNYIIYSSEEKESGKPLPAKILEHISGQSSAAVMDDDYLVTINSCAESWYVICSVPTRIILRERNDIISYTVIIAAIASVFAIILGAVLSIYVTNPVNNIVSVLNDQAKLDRLTGIFNKLSFEDTVSQMLMNAGSDEHHAIILLDVDNFKGVNDTLGHVYGDKVLADIGNILRVTFNSSDCLGRIGGDEFCVLLNIPKNRQSTYNELINEKCTELCEAFHRSYTGDDGNYKISSSIGVAVFPENGHEFPELYKCADKALYISKHKGKDTYTVFNENEEEKEVSRV